MRIDLSLLKSPCRTCSLPLIATCPTGHAGYRRHLRWRCAAVVGAVLGRSGATPDATIGELVRAALTPSTRAIPNLVERLRG